MTGFPRPPELAYGIAVLGLVLSYAFVALAPGVNSDAAWNRARRATAFALALSAASCLAVAAFGALHATLATLAEFGPAGALTASLRLDSLAAVMLLLVSSIGFAILRFSRAYLDGDGRQAYYVRWLMATLAAVALLIVTDNLLMLALSWIATSLSLHRLLTLYPERVWAQIAAHKKFLVSRAADACLLAAVAWIGLHFGSLELSSILPRTSASDLASPGAQAAIVLLAFSAALKCAQLPFHGWLMQVMEAPTPVSALLHAGVINIGGFLMMRLAPLMAQSELAQTLLVAWGTATAVVAALVMTTRVSVKVMLAWSTCAQMGFMLLECGLGAYPLALLHLVGHSLYKAHAFLGSGSAVEQWRAQAQAPAPPAGGIAASLAAAAGALLAVAAVCSFIGADPRRERALWALMLIVALALAAPIPKVARGAWRAFAWAFVAGASVAPLYFGWHAAFSRLLAPQAGAPTTLQLAIVIAGFAFLYVVSSTLVACPRGRLARWLQPHLFAGLYLDELFTRMTFRIWPARSPRGTRNAGSPPIAAPRDRPSNQEMSP